MQTQKIDRMQFTAGDRSPIAVIGLAMLLATVLLLGTTGSAFAAAEEPPQMTVNYFYDWVGVEAGNNQDVEVTVVGKASIAGSTGENGRFAAHEWTWDPEQPQIEPGDTVTGTVNGTLMVVDPVGRITGRADYEADTVSGTIEASWFSPQTLTVRCEAYGEGDSGNIEVDSVDPDGGSYTCDFSAESWDLQPEQTVAVFYIQPDGHRVNTIIEAPWMRVNYGHDWVGANYEAGHTFTITLTDSADSVKAVAEIETVPGGGWGGDGFQTRGEDWQPEQSGIQAGDRVHFSADDGYTATVRVGEIESNLDFDADTISGKVNAAWLSPDLLKVRCEIWEEGRPDDIEVMDVDADGGSYTCDFTTVSWDLQPGQTVAVSYVQPNGDRVISNPSAPVMRVNYGGDWVGVDYEVGHTFLITVTDSADAVKATAEIETTSGAGWGGDGFQSEGDDWQPDQPDIQPGDLVHFSADDGYSNIIRVGEISGTVNVATDSISGPIYADWIEETLDVECHPWGSPGDADNKRSSAEPDGSVPYACDWAGEWDVQPGQNMAVFYAIPGTGDIVGNEFRGKATRYVAKTGSDDDENPCTDAAAPCLTLVRAIDEATDGDDILIAEGTYAEHINMNDGGLTVRGGYTISGAQWLPGTGETIIEGAENESIFRINGRNVVLQGLTITGAQTDSSGGAISIRNRSSVDLIDLKIHSNSADSAGGVEIRDDSTVNIVDTQIYGNSAIGGEGGGLRAEGSDVRLIQSWVVANVATGNDGGGFVAEEGSVYIENSIIAGNDSDENGGGLWISGTESSTIVNSHIVGNQTSGEGAAIATKAATRIVMTNTLIISNTGNTGIADRDAEGSIFELNFCDTYGNSSDGTDGVTITRTNCLGLPASDGLNPRMAGGSLPAGVGPSFADAWMAYDYRPAAGSPVIDGGTNDGAPTDDIAGGTRPQDGDLNGDAVTDMGAYELSASHLFLPVTLTP